MFEWLEVERLKALLLDPCEGEEEECISPLDYEDVEKGEEDGKKDERISCR